MFCKSNVVQQLENLYNNPDAGAKQNANQYLMRFQEDPTAWAVSQELLAESSPQIQFMGAQTLYLKVKRQWDTLPDKAAFTSHLFNCLRAAPGTLQANTTLRLALCVSALIVRNVLSGWPSAVEDVIQFGRDSSVRDGRRLAAQILAAVPEELNDLPQMAHTKTSPPAMALLSKTNLLIAFILETLDTGDVQPDGLCQLALQCLVQWTKALDVRFCEHEALSQRMVQLLSVDALVEGLLEAFIECLQNSSMASSVWKVKDWATKVPGKKILDTGAEGKCLRALLQQIHSIHPRLDQVCAASAATGRWGELDEQSEKLLCAWARVVVMLCESFTQLLFESECEFLIQVLGCCFRLSPATAQPLFEFWGQMKEMQREAVLSTSQVQVVLMRLTEPCIVSLLRYIHRDLAAAAGYGEDLGTLRTVAKDVTCDIFCLWQKCDSTRSGEFVSFLAQHLLQAIGRQDAPAAEAALVLLEGVVDVMEALPPQFIAALQQLPSMPADAGAMGAAAVLLRSCAPHMENHVALLPELLQFLLNALPLAPHTAAESLLELTGYCGAHLASSLSRFLPAIEGIAPNYPVKVDANLFSAVVCTVRRLGVADLLPAFQSVLASTLQQLEQAQAEIQETADGRLVVAEPLKERLYRLLSRLRACVWTLEQAPEEGETPRAGQLKGPKASAILAVMVSKWSAVAKVLEVVLAAAPPDLTREVQSHARGRTDGADAGVTDAAIAIVAVKLLRSCIAAAKSQEIPEADSNRFVQMLLQLTVAVMRRQPAHHHALSPLAELLPLAASRPSLKAEFSSAFQGVCEFTLQRLQAPGARQELVEVTPLFELMLAAAEHLPEALYGCSCFPQLEQLAVAALQSPDRELNKVTLQFLLHFQASMDPRVQAHFAEFAPSLVRAMLQSFHKWPQATRRNSTLLFTTLLERHPSQFHTALVQLWQQPGTTGVHECLSPEHREVCLRLFGSLRGPRLKAFLWDLAAVANGAQTVDVLLSYQMPAG